MWLSQNTSCVSILNVSINQQKSTRLILLVVITEEHFTMITGSIPQEDIAILNVYIANNNICFKIYEAKTVGTKRPNRKLHNYS